MTILCPLQECDLLQHYQSLSSSSLYAQHIRFGTSQFILAAQLTWWLFPSDKMFLYDDWDEEVLKCYHEMTLANLIFYGLKEGACSEQSSRMTAMEAASKNAGEPPSLCCKTS